MSLKINISTCFLLIVAFVALQSCAKKIHFATSTVVPAARGNVLLKKDHNKNYLIEVQLYDLAEIDRLKPTQNNYVVWMNNTEGRTRKLGHLVSGHSFFSRKLKAHFETASSTKPTKIFITAEVDDNATYPSNFIVLETHQF